MISFLLLCITLSAENKNLLETINIYSGFTTEEIQNLREEKQKEYDEMMAECKQNEYMKDMCETIYAAFKPENIISEEEVDETIKKIDSFTLIIQSFGYYGKIDLSMLKKRAALVSIAQNGRMDYLPSATKINIERIQKEMKSIKFDGSLNNMLKVHNIILSHTKNEKAYGKQGTLEIVGDIKSKVGYLQVTAGITRIVDNPLNSDSATFLMGTLSSDSQPINVKYLTVDLYAYKSLNMDIIQVQQFFLTFIFDRTYSDYEYNKIHYTENAWTVNVGNSRSDSYLTKLSFNLPYTSAERFGVISNALTFIITRVIDEFDVKGLNITVGVPTATGANLNTKETIHLILDDNWINSEVKPKVNIVADKNQYDLDQSEAPKLNAGFESHYVETPSSKNNNNKKIGIIIGVVVAVVVVIAVIVVVIVILKKKKAAKEGSSNQEGEENAEQA